MKKLLLLLSAVCLVASQAWAVPPLRITRTQADILAGTLSVHGVSFGLQPPEVTLDQHLLVLVDYIPETEITVEIPADLAAGTYLLTVKAFDLSDSDTFNVTLGAGGGTGPQITRTEVDESAGEILIVGRNFGDALLGDPIPEVTFGDLLFPLTVLDFEDTLVTVEQPLVPQGTYSLTVSLGASSNDSFDMVIGGDITGVTAGDGLEGGGDTGEVTLHVDSAIARSSEILPTVLGNDGSGSGLDADLLDGLDSSAFLSASTTWSLTGNAGTVPGTHFLGTTDGQALDFRVGNFRALRLQPGSTPSVIAGSASNSVGGHAGQTVGGGGSAGLPNQATNAMATVGGGAGNIASGIHATVAGGRENTASGWSSTVAGGQNNQAFAHSYTTVGGGLDNTAGNLGATVPGGRGNTASGFYSFAAGRRAKANWSGSFVWGDQNDFDVSAFGTNSFVARATGGVRFITGIDGVGAPTAGVTVPAGGGAWSSLSDVGSKENFTPLDPVLTVRLVAQLPIETWNYRSQDDSVRHLGPTAQDFHAAFGLGESDRYISTVDTDGVALAAIQGLFILLQDKDKELAALQQDVLMLQAEIRKLRQ